MAGSSRRQSLYEAKFEHDACGVGFIANIDAQADHRTILDALRALARLKHRGAIDADQKTGDGTGVQFQVPRAFFRDEYARLTGDKVADDELMGVGTVFLSRKDTAQARRIVEHVLRRRGYDFVWRDVPVDLDVLGQKAMATMPHIAQVIVRGGAHSDEPLDFDRRLYVMRKEIGQRAAVADVDETYFVSFSCRRLIYKGLTVADALGDFYPDLRNEAFVSAYCVFHQRYSTNTFPSWSLAQPFDMLGHNGEINTVLGNGNGTKLREGDLSSPIWGADIEYLTPILDQSQSDSAQLDDVLELLTLSGRGILHAVEMLIPAAWEAMPDVDPNLKAFYEYLSLIHI